MRAERWPEQKMVADLLPAYFWSNCSNRRKPVRRWEKSAHEMNRAGGKRLIAARQRFLRQPLRGCERWGVRAYPDRARWEERGIVGSPAPEKNAHSCGF